jgi:molecular chaperone IbpA
MTQQLTLGRIDFAPFHRYTVGLDDLFTELSRVNTQQEANYPPYNIIKYNEDAYAIELAVAGFELTDIEINVEGNHLTVTGNRENKGGVESTYVHRGISTRSFSKSFTLGNYLEVNGATLKNGMLNISLVRVLPDNMKPRKISITKDSSK